MLYRRSPRTPPRLLLRIVATAGAGTLMGIAACGGETSSANGFLSNPQPDAAQSGDDDSGDIAMGIASSGSGSVCDPCGFIPSGVIDSGDPGDDGSDAGSPDGSIAAGSTPIPGDASVHDAGPDAYLIGINGIVVHPQDASADANDAATAGHVGLLGLVPPPL